MRYDLSKMEDRIKLLMKMPTKKHRNSVLFLIERRYPEELEQTKQEFMRIWNEAR